MDEPKPEPPAAPAPESRPGNCGNMPPREHQWKKGQSGNPGGRPRSLKRLMREARKSGLDMLAVLEAIARDTSAKGSERVAAATALLDRGYGKPTQGIEVAGPGGGPVVTRDLGRLSDAELALAEEILAKVETDGGKPSGS